MQIETKTVVGKSTHICYLSKSINTALHEYEYWYENVIKALKVESTQYAECPISQGIPCIEIF